jgi:hypothetical protein
MAGLIGPDHRPLVNYVYLGGKEGYWDYDYYLLEGGSVWCHESPSSNGYSRSRWVKIEDGELDSIVLDGKSLRQRIAERKAHP